MPEPRAQLGIDATALRRHPLIARLLARGWEFDFFQAAWLLERCLKSRAPIGGRGPLADEGLRFRPDHQLGFPATDLRRVAAREEPDPGQSFFQLDVTFMGLYGVATPLPLHYAIDVLRAVDQAPTVAPSALPPDPDRPGPAVGQLVEPPVRSFLDIFHHRLISLFYRAGNKYRYDRVFGLPGRDAVTDYLFWLIGCPRSYDRATLGVDPVRLIRYAGILTQQPRSAATLEGLLVDYWENIPIECLQFDGRWLTLATTDLNRLGTANSRLGVDLTVGEQVFDLGGAFRVAAGPVDWPTYVSFLPDGERFLQTRSLTRLYSLDPLAFSIEVRLRAGEVPETRLSSTGEAGRLGYTSWVRTQEVGETSVIFDCTLDRNGG